MQQRILIIRLSAIGDVVMSSGVIPALRKAYPDAHIAWLAEPGPDALLRANPRLDEVIAWPRPRWRALWQARRFATLAAEIAGFSRALRRRRFTQVLDMQGLLKSGIWARLSGAPERIGLGSREGSQHFMTRVVSREGRDKRIGAEYRKLAECLGCDPLDFQLDLAVGEEAAWEAAVQLHGLGLGGRYAVIAPFTTRPQKHWVESRWAELAARIAAELDLPVLMLGGPADKAASGRIREHGADLHDLTGRLGLAASAAVVRGAGLLVGVDTGLTHMGTAFRVPTVALFGSTRPYLKPEAPATHIIYKALSCAPCRHNPTCGGAYTCMRDISVDDVMRAAARTMENK